MPRVGLVLGGSSQAERSASRLLAPYFATSWKGRVAGTSAEALCKGASDPVQTLLGSQKLLLGVPRGEAASTEICQLAQLTLALDPPASSSGVVPDLWVKSHRAFLFPLEEVGAPNMGLQDSPGAMAPCHHSHTLGRVSGRCVARPCHNTFACLRII